MAVRKRVFIPNRIYFITFTILNWQKVFVSRKYCDLVYKGFDYQKYQYGNKVHGYVIMPNHLHLLVYVTKASPPLSKLIQNSKRFLAYGIIKELERDKAVATLMLFREHALANKGAKHKVFEDGFDSKLVESETFCRQKLDYIHHNPCREPWNLAVKPEEYIYSSATNYYLGSGLYPVDRLTF